VVHFENGKSLTIIAHNNSKQNVYIQSAKLNGADYTRSYITYNDVVKGGTLEFEMSATPNQSWGSSDADVPVTKIP
jgi:putative alpha-1,2-mannosidase